MKKRLNKIRENAVTGDTKPVAAFCEIFLQITIKKSPFIVLMCVIYKRKKFPNVKL